MHSRLSDLLARDPAQPTPPRIPPGARPIDWVVDEIPRGTSDYWRDFRFGAPIISGDGRHQNGGICVACRQRAGQDLDCRPAVEDLVDRHLFAGVQDDDIMAFGTWFDTYYVLVIPDRREPPTPASAFAHSPDRRFDGNYARGRKLVKPWWRLAMRPEMRVQLTLQPRRALVKVAYAKRTGIPGLSATRMTDGTVVGANVGYFTADSEQEAAYLTALLNAPALQLAYEHCGTYYYGGNTWSYGGQHFFRVPVPRFDARNALHQRLAELCVDAEAITKATFDDLPTRFEVYWESGVQERKWSEVRQRLLASGIPDQIDDVARELLPEHAVQIYGPASRHPWRYRISWQRVTWRKRQRRQTAVPGRRTFRRRPRPQRWFG